MEPAMNCRLQPEDYQVVAGTTHHPSSVAALRGVDATCINLPRSRDSRTAFSLLEVMIASGIFFMCVFAILAMVSSVLRNARSLRRTELDAGMVAAKLVGTTNKLFEGTESGDFGNLYPDYSYETAAYEAGTNGLWQVDIVVRRRGVPQPVDSMSIYVFSPESSLAPGRPR
jgi:hypothetical protein